MIQTVKPIAGLVRRTAGAGGLLLLLSCTPPAGQSGPGGGTSVGEPRVFDTVSGRRLEEGRLWARLAAADFLILGETHDNAEHHRLQARIVRRLEAMPPGVGAVAFEMLTVDRQPVVDRHLAAADADLAVFAEAVGWQRSGWPDFALYEPVFAAAVESGARVLAADLAAGVTARIRKEGFAALDPAFVRRTGLDRPLPPALEEGLRETLARAHCGRLPESVLSGMLRVQRARDAMLADRVASFGGDGRVVLITGNGHARKDWGVPFYLARLAPGRRIVSVGLIEVRPGEALEPAGRPFDLVWFTGGPRRGADPCASMGGGMPADTEP